MKLGIRSSASFGGKAAGRVSWLLAVSLVVPVCAIVGTGVGFTSASAARVSSNFASPSPTGVALPIDRRAIGMRNPDSIVSGSDGALWFMNHGNSTIGRMTTNGSVSIFTDPSFSFRSDAGDIGGDIVVGPDGNLWFTNHNGRGIGRITPAGAVSMFTGDASNEIISSSSIAVGHDGNIWFTSETPSHFDTELGRITPSGQVKTYSEISNVSDIVGGPDGDMWAWSSGSILRTSTGGVPQPSIPVPGLMPFTQHSMLLAPDGNVWSGVQVAPFGSPGILRVSPNGVTTLFTSPNLGSKFPGSLVVGPDNALWFGVDSRLGRIDSSGAMSFVEMSGADPQGEDMSLGADGNFWMVGASFNAIFRISMAGEASKFYGNGINNPAAPAAAPDGTTWFINSLGMSLNSGQQSIGKITPGGAVDYFTDEQITGPSNSFNTIGGVAVGPDGNAWITIQPETGPGSIAKVSPTGAISHYSSPLFDSPSGIALGPDGALWFTNGHSIGRITTAGAMSTFPNIGGMFTGSAITAGPDGSMWFLGGSTSPYRPIVGRISATGSFSMYPLPNWSDSISAGPDGNVWMSGNVGSGVLRISPGGVVTSFTDANLTDTASITSGPDGHLWFISTDLAGAHSIGRITTSGQFSYVALGLRLSGDPGGIALGADGNMWMTDRASNSLFTVSPHSNLASFSLSPWTGPAPLSVTANASGVGPWSSYSWDWGDGSTDSAGVTVGHTYSSPGFFSVTLTAADRSGGSASFTKWVHAASNAGTYVALGDSYSSGEGAGSYDPTAGDPLVPTGPPLSSSCDRSSQAYGRLGIAGFANRNVILGACSGAVTDNVGTEANPYGVGQFGELGQLGRLRQIEVNHPEVTPSLVTISIGGNDANFGGIVLGCQLAAAGGGGCQSAYQAWLASQGKTLDDVLAVVQGHVEDTLKQVRKAARGAKIVLVGYPAIYPDNPTSWWNGGCNIQRSDAVWLRSLYQQADLHLQSAARDAGVTFLDVFDAFAGHEVCNPKQSSEWANGLSLSLPLHLNGSFHPNAAGNQRLNALLNECLAGTYKGCRNSQTALVAPLQTSTTNAQIGNGDSAATFSTTWSGSTGSTVSTTLVSPTGRIINAASIAPDVTRAADAATESFTLTNPEAGVWTIEMYGTNVATAGEATNVVVNEQQPLLPATNQAPRADFTTTGTTGPAPFTVNFDGARSGDTDGTIASFGWDFGDGDVSTAAATSHTFSQPGTYTPKLTVTDDRGAKDTLIGAQIKVVAPPGSGFHPVAPSRILDSRTVNGGWSGKLAAGTSRTLQVTGLAGGSSVPAAASAVVLNVTATGASAGSFVSVWPAGTAQPNVSSLNFGAGETIPNLVTVKIGAGGKVSFANAVGTVDVIADVVGFYDDGTGPGDLFTGVTPTRLLDSRTTNGGWNAKLTVGAPRDLLVRQPGNAAGVPATATAVIANVTVTGATAGSFVSVWPTGVAQPNVSNLNFGAGQTIPNLVIVKIGDDGKIRLANAVGAVDVIVDVVGYFDPSSGSRFHAITPTRILDDRINQGLSGPWGPGQTRTLAVAGAAGTNVPAGATGLVTNVTATGATAGSFITVFPAGTAVPNSSNLNFGAGQTIPNLVTAKLGATGQIAFYNKLGTVHIIADTVGYYATT